MNILKLAKSVFTGMLLGMKLYTIWAHGKEARLIFAEVDDKLFRMKGTVCWLHEETKMNRKRN
jgi:hypothetical protein